MNVVTKATATVGPVESDYEHGEFDVILSTSALDRDGDELKPDEWKHPLPEHITFDSDHGMSVSTTVGSGTPFINDDGQLQVRGRFASTPHAQAVRTLVKEGHIRSTSVAFMTRKSTKGAGVERELLNGAFVAVPANPEAVVLASKSASELAEQIAAGMMTKEEAAEFVLGIKKPDKDDDKKPYGDVVYADPKNNKYPIDTAEHVRAAWSYINMPKNSSEYSAEELARIKDKIKAAANKFGVEISEKSRLESMIKAMAKHDDMVQAIHDAACQIGAMCPDAGINMNSGATDGANKDLAAIQLLGGPPRVAIAHTGNFSKTFTGAELQDGTVLKWLNDKTSSIQAGLPQESTEESAAPTATKAAGTADESAEDVALQAKRLVIELRNMQS